ncbi:hypothetical protein CQ054_20915 [Ochrobactrum sp. MYb29]|nr:hypothetical protein CQ054_20915 [Ochrobactrum sp. MYb29]
MQPETPTASLPPSLRWLHFSDLHVGMKGQDSLWPRFGTLLTDELHKTLERMGGIDVVIFSGDLVQTGHKDEYEKFDAVINEVLDCIGTVQGPTKLITVPGNHDLVRPDHLEPAAMALKSFWATPALREGIWEKGGKSFRDCLETAFANYSDWQQRSIDSGRHLEPSARGILPGDAAYVLDTPSGRFGVAALNSTWLQLSGGDYQGSLHVDAKQLHAITSERPDAWTRGNIANILVTHQPASWLHATRPSTWQNDINPSGRFDLHLFGHMHEPEVSSVAFGGGLSQQSVQAASLFGLETFGNGAQQRIQGYSGNRIFIDGEDRFYTCWPRRLVSLVGGKMKLTPDGSQDIDEDTGSCTVPYAVDRRTTPTQSVVPLEASAVSVGIDLSLPSDFDPSSIRFSLGSCKGHAMVRRLEQETAVECLRRTRIVWIASDWGMGHEGFISSIARTLGVPDDAAFSIDFNNFTTRVALFDEIKVRLGVSFEQVCESIADTGVSVLIFDQIDLAASNAADGAVADIEKLAKTISDFAPDAFILIRSSKAPHGSTYRVVELKALDEADVGVYAGKSELGDVRYSKPDAASKIFRHTDGVPSRIDDALRDLGLMSLEDLLSSDPDFTDAGGGLVAAPPALVATVAKFRESNERAEQRAYELLLALSALPNGEQLIRLKRFLGPHPIGAIHARPLLERSLIDTGSLASLDALNEDSTAKVLVVPRLVREFVRDTIDENKAREIDHLALELYFGEKWTIGEIHNSATGKRVRQALCDGYEIQNAIALILRTSRRALEGGDQFEIENALRLAAAFVDILRDGDHYRSAAGLCEDVLRIFANNEDFERELNRLRYYCARSLRMISRYGDARAYFELLDHDLLTRNERQLAELSLAFCLDSEGETDTAIEAAKRVIAIDKNSASAVQAKALIAEHIQDGEERRTALRRLLATAKKRNNHVAANNILITLAGDGRRNGEETGDLLKEIIGTSRKTGDFYNAARAITALARQPGAEDLLTPDEKMRLIEAYHFFYTERLYNQFDLCHGALWKVLEKERDPANLLNLFRHSSFIWRLNGREEQEIKYLALLTQRVRDLIAGGLSHTTRDGAYYMIRVSVVMGALPTADVEMNV